MAHLLFIENEILLYSGQQTTPLIIPSVIKQRRQVIAVKTLFCKIFSNEISETANFCEKSLCIQWYYIFNRKCKLHFCQKNAFKHWSFVISWKNAYSTTQSTTPSICHQQTAMKVSYKSHKYTLFVVWVWVNWDKIYMRLL